MLCNQKLCWGVDFQKAWALRQGLSLENLAEFQRKPGFRDLLYVRWAQRDSLSCKFMPSLGGTESYWFPCALWRDQTSSACDLSAPHLKALPWQPGQPPYGRGMGNGTRWRRDILFSLMGKFPIIEKGEGGKLGKSSGLIGKWAYSKANTMPYVSHLPMRSSVSLSGKKMCFPSKSRATQAIYMNK